MNRNLINNLKGSNYYSSESFQYQNMSENSNIEMTHISIDKEFDSQINYLQKELDRAKEDIQRLRQLGTQLKTTVSYSRANEITKTSEGLHSEISSRLRDIGTKLLALGTATKNKPKDKNTSVCISVQRKLANDLKHTLEEYNEVREENQNEAYRMFKHQYKISHFDATEAEIKRSFEESNESPFYIQDLSNSQRSRRAYQESQDRNEQIKKIERSIEELLYTFQDMQTMLATQKETMVTIEDNIDDAEVKIQKGSNDMIRAIETRKSSRKKLWIITIIILVVLCILCAYIYNIVK